MIGHDAQQFELLNCCKLVLTLRHSFHRERLKLVNNLKGGARRYRYSGDFVKVSTQKQNGQVNVIIL